MANEPLQVTITGDVKGLTDALERGTSGIKGFAKDTEAVTKGLGNVIANLKAPFIALAAIFGGGAFLKGTVNETKDWTVEAQKLARVLGITTEQASVLNLAVGDIYGTTEEYLGAVGKLTKTLNTNEDAFKRLGVATRDSNGHLRPTADIMTDVNTALMKVKSGTDRNIESQRIYGKSWMEVQRYLGLTQEVMDAAREKAEKLNLIVGQDAVTATSAYRGSMNDLDDTMKGLKIRIGTELMPVLTTLNNDLAESGPGAVSALGSAFQWLYGIILGLREEFETFGAEVNFLWKRLELGATAAGLQIKALLSGDLDAAAQIATAYAASLRDLSFGAAQELNAIQDKYTAKQMTLLGLDRKKPSTVPGGGGTGNAGDGETKNKNVDNEALSYNEMVEWSNRYLQKRQQVHDRDAELAAQKAEKDRQERAEWMNEESKKFTLGVSLAQAWRDGVAAAGNYVRSSFVSMASGILQGQMTFANGIRTVWKNVTQIITQSLAQVLQAKVKAFFAERAIEKAKQTENLTTTGTNTVEATSGVFKAHAGIPWVGVAIALGMIALMMATMKKAKSENGIVANAQGSLVTGPTLGWLGEAGQNEVVAPEMVFKDWAGNLTQNIIANERRVQAYQMQGAGYASAVREAGGMSPIDMRGSVFFGESAETDRLLGKRFEQIRRRREMNG